MKTYIKTIKKYKLLSREEERKLLIKAKDGDSDARELLINSNLRFVISIAKNYLGQGLSLEDLVGEGNYGLIQALDRFDLSRNNKFITYAVWWIRHYIFQAISSANSGSVRLPTNKQQLLTKIVKAKDRLEQELCRPPTQQELEEELQIKLDDHLPHSYLSLDVSYLDDGTAPLYEILPDDSVDVEQAFIDDRLEMEIERLLNGIEDDRERLIIKYYHGLNLVRTYTLEEIGNFFNISRERVRQIKEKSLTKLANTAHYKHLKQHLED